MRVLLTGSRLAEERIIRRGIDFQPVREILRRQRLPVTNVQWRIIAAWVCPRDVD